MIFSYGRSSPRRIRNVQQVTERRGDGVKARHHYKLENLLFYHMQGKITECWLAETEGIFP